MVDGESVEVFSDLSVARTSVQDSQSKNTTIHMPEPERGDVLKNHVVSLDFSEGSEEVAVTIGSDGPAK